MPLVKRYVIRERRRAFLTELMKGTERHHCGDFTVEGKCVVCVCERLGTILQLALLLRQSRKIAQEPSKAEIEYLSSFSKDELKAKEEHEWTKLGGIPPIFCVRCATYFRDFGNLEALLRMAEEHKLDVHETYCPTCDARILVPIKNIREIIKKNRRNKQKPVSP